MWIVHPSHPLSGQRVLVVQKRGTGAASQWVIQLDDQTWARIPVSWAVPADEETASPPVPCVSVGDLWTDVTGLLRLARMVHRLSAVQPTEEESDDAKSQDATGGSWNGPAGPEPALLARPTTGTPASCDHSTDENDGQMARGTASSRGGT